MKNIHVNQLGYRTNAAKLAVIPSGRIQAFELVRVSDNAVVYSGQTSAEIFDEASDMSVKVADFSEFSEEGKYKIRAGVWESYPFYIDKNPYAGLRGALLDMFGHQKCGVAVDFGIWSHPPCHTSLATIYDTNEKKDVSGGWHDAGDYGRYIVPAAKTIADLLLAHKFAKTKDVQLPGICWFELEWMLKMQCEKTGGVYHKVSCRTFNALDEMPQNEQGELILSPVSLSATADFAAITALASGFFPEKKERLLSAAKRAWAWCAASPNAPGFVNPPEVRTGQYGDEFTRDELFWAACQLFAATGEAEFHDFIKQSEIFTGMDWASVGTYGIVAYLSAENQDVGTAAAMKAKLHATCEEILGKFHSEPYGTSQGTHYRWGSNLNVAGNAAALLLYDRIVEPNPAYTAAAAEHMHYLLGRNPLSQSYITGFGANAAKNPHHRPSVAVNAAPPGMVAGGPNNTTPRDEALQTACEGRPPSMFYVDDKNSFASNEVAIYWNSAVYFVAAMLDF